MGRNTFTAAELDAIKALLREVRRADRSRQKTLRNKLRGQFGFYISDFVHDQQGFTGSDVDSLVRRGTITVIGDAHPAPTKPTAAEPWVHQHTAAKGSLRSGTAGARPALPRSFDREDLETAGFSGWNTWEQLRTTNLIEVPFDPAAYVVYRASSDEPAFVEVSPGGWFKGQDPTVAVEVLQAKWVHGARTIYIGKADVARRRLKEFARFGVGEPVGHRGGRYIWQLADLDELLVAWRVVQGDGTARDVEQLLLARFGELHDGQRPFANLTG